MVILFHLHPDFPGWMGVDIFFALSGFLVTGIILEHRHEKSFFFTFHMRRSLRIFPVYFAAIAAVMLLSRLFEQTPYWDSSLINLATFTANIQSYWGDPVQLPHFALRAFWSLSIEEQYYVIWPLLIGLVMRFSSNPLVLLLIFSTPLTARYLGLKPDTLLSRCDGLLFGSGLVYAFRLAKEQGQTENFKRALTWITGGIALFIVGGLAVQGVRFLETVRDPLHPVTVFTFTSVFAAGLVGLLVTHSGSQYLAWLRHPSMVYLGTISYGIYAYHLASIWLVNGFTKRLGLELPFWTTDMVKTVLAVAIAAASWKFFEKPILSLAKNFPYHRSENYPGEKTPNKAT